MVTNSPPTHLEWRGQDPVGGASELPDLLAPLRRKYKLVFGAARELTVDHLDTVDWRVRRAGLQFSHEVESGAVTLVVAGPRGRFVAPLPRPAKWPRLAEQLPSGELHDEIVGPLWIRAVRPVLHSTVATGAVDVLDTEGAVVASLMWIETSVVGPVETPPMMRLSVHPVAGHERHAARVVRALNERSDFGTAELSRYEQLLAAAGVEVERPARSKITAAMRADVAVATALRGFADAVDSNVEGTIDDVDTEFLHDLRVAVRRTRSLLKLAGDVLTPEVRDRFAAGFKWLGDLTTPTRDLDVYLLEVPDLTKRLTIGAPADLQPFAAHLRRRRATARRSLVRELRSERFSDLMTDWRVALDHAVEHGSEDPSGEPVPAAAQLATDRLHRAYKRVRARARALTPESPADDVHALRKRCKELRYLLEVFRDLLDSDTYSDSDAYSGMLKSLKRLQNILGDFQDGEVQSEALRVFAQEMLDQGPPPAATLLAMGELSARFAEQQRLARQALTEALPGFLGGLRMQ